MLPESREYVFLANVVFRIKFMETFVILITAQMLSYVIAFPRSLATPENCSEGKSESPVHVTTFSHKLPSILDTVPSRERVISGE